MMFCWALTSNPKKCNHVVLSFLPGVVSCSHYGISGSVSAVTVRPGDNITLHCDCKLSTGTYTVWFRNCSHENQPTLVLNAKPDEMWKHFQEYSRYEFMKNSSSDSYDLLIVNVTESDEGIYYCGTEETKVEQEKQITSKVIYRYSNTTTRLTISKYFYLDLLRDNIMSTYLVQWNYYYTEDQVGKTLCSLNIGCLLGCNWFENQRLIKCAYITHTSFLKCTHALGLVLRWVYIWNLGKWAQSGKKAERCAWRKQLEIY